MGSEVHQWLDPTTLITLPRNLPSAERSLRRMTKGHAYQTHTTLPVHIASANTMYTLIN